MKTSPTYNNIWDLNIPSTLESSKTLIWGSPKLGCRKLNLNDMTKRTPGSVGDCCIKINNLCILL